jgi:hypothetical protein
MLYPISSGNAPGDASCSIARPNAWREQFQQMIVTIAEINAGATARPLELALNNDLARAKANFPFVETFGRDPESKVTYALGTMRWNGAERQDRPLRIAAANEEKQHLLASNVESAESMVRSHDWIAEQIGVKLLGASKVSHAKTSFENCAGEHHTIVPEARIFAREFGVWGFEFRVLSRLELRCANSKLETPNSKLKTQDPKLKTASASC